MDVTPQQTAQALGAGTQIVDVREADELADGVIPGARHIPLGELRSRVRELDPALPVITVCRSGRRSAAAADQFAAAGFSADTMAGGMLAWQAAGLPTA